MKKNKITAGLIAILCCVLLTNCNKDIPPGDYDAAEVGKIKKVVPGTIISMRAVRLHNKNGDNINPSTGDGYSENGNARSHGYEYVVKLNSGAIISVVQTDNIKLKNKQHILVIYGAHTRVVPDHGSSDEY